MATCKYCSTPLGYEDDPVFEIYEPWEKDYCKVDCWRKSDEFADVKADCERLVSPLDRNLKKRFLNILEDGYDYLLEETLLEHLKGD